MFVFLLPYVCASLWGHVGVEKEVLQQSKYHGKTEGTAARWVQVDMKWGTWEIPMEEYLVYKLESVIPDTYELEALKAQAVLLRTEVMMVLQEEDSDSLRVSGDGFDKWYEAGEKEETELQPFRQAVEETDGLYLCYRGNPIQASYFRLSSGKTRDAGQVWGTDKFPYLTSVSCVQDQSAQDYSSEVTVSKTDFLFEIQSRLGDEYSGEELWDCMEYSYDDAGYVTNVSFIVEGEEAGRMDGETFRYLFGLPSASFETEQTQMQIIFHVAGVGHGFGMSQYSANCRALNGETYDRILKDFFSGTELAKIE